MPDITVSADIHSFMQAANAAAARAVLSSASLSANTFNDLQTLGLTALGTTPSPASLLTNSTAAAAGAQQYSPALTWSGNGWKTNATAASQSVAFRAFVQTVQGAAAPYGVWTLQQSVNGGTYVGGLEYTVSTGTYLAYLKARGTTSSHNYSFNIGPDTTSVEQRFNDVCQSVWNDSGQTIIGPTGTYAFASTGGDAIRYSADTFIMRKAAATIQLGADAAGVTNQHLTAASRITSDGVGANLTISGGNGRGAAGGSVIFSTYSTEAVTNPGILTTRLTLDTNGLLTFAEGVNLVFGGSTGTKIGNTASDKIGFWGVTPIAQYAHIADSAGDAGTGADTVDLTTLNATLNSIHGTISSINAMLASTGLTAAA